MDDIDVLVDWEMTESPAAMIEHDIAFELCVRPAGWRGRLWGRYVA